MIIILKEICISFLQVCKTKTLQDQNMGYLRKKVPIFASSKDKLFQGFPIFGLAFNLIF
jgi:hypothetical protein